MPLAANQNSAPSDVNAKLSLALFIMRLSLALFLLPWVIEKFTKPETTAKIFAHFYHVKNLSVFASYGIGILWALLLCAFAVGYKKRISYGLVLLLHAVGTIFTWKQLLPFLDTHNHLFLASIPTLGALIALYMLRDHDVKWTFG